MKTSLLILTISFSLCFGTVSAQDKTEVQLNHITIANNSSPKNYSVKIKYQYYPNLRAYFNTETLDYLYEVNQVWITTKEIPSSYRGYSIYNNHRVDLLGYCDDKPYENITEHIKLYPYYSNDRKGKLVAMKAKKISDEKLLTVK